MENSLVLSHLPWHLAQHEAVDFVRELSEAPALRDVADALCAKAKSAKAVWIALDQATRQAELTRRIMTRLNIRAIDFWSPHYPRSLRFIENPPWTLYYLGELPRGDVPTLAVVGTRKPNNYGREVLGTILPQLTYRPLQLVSGLAYGIDALAHHYANEADIPNFAIMGCGLDILYPAEHAELAAAILEGDGGLISEYPPGTQPLPRNFPRRNRIIAGLSQFVWIVQGTAKSGTVHTLDHALKQDKTVVATPGDIFSELSELPNRLLYDGAQMIAKAQDLDLLLHRNRAIVTH